jgi:hypothetical protein
MISVAKPFLAVLLSDAGRALAHPLRSEQSASVGVRICDTGILKTRILDELLAH